MTTSVCPARQTSVLSNTSFPVCHIAGHHRGAPHRHRVSLRVCVCHSPLPTKLKGWKLKWRKTNDRPIRAIYSHLCVCVLQPLPLSRRLSSSREVVRPNLQRGERGRTAEMTQRYPTARLKTVRNICVNATNNKTIAALLLPLKPLRVLVLLTYYYSLLTNVSTRTIHAHLLKE